MTDDDDDNDLFPRASVLRRVLAFTFRLWRRRPALAAACVGAMLLSTLTEVFGPPYAGALIDAVGRGDPAAAWHAFAMIAGLSGAMVVFRHLGWWAITPFTLGMMRDVTQEAFARVQRLSSDWHSNAFSGSTVRRITRGMWALDLLNDVLLLSLLPSLTWCTSTEMRLSPGTRASRAESRVLDCRAALLTEFREVVSGPMVPSGRLMRRASTPLR